MQNITVAPGNFSYFQLNSSGISGNSIFSIGASVFSGKVDAYIFNATGFKAWEADAPSATENGLQGAIALEGNGTLLIFENVTKAFTYSVPAGPSQLNQSNYTSVAYDYRGINFSNAGRYYFVLDNTNQGTQRLNAAKVLVSFVGPTTESVLARNPAMVNLTDLIGSAQSTINNIYIIFGGLFMVGLIVAIVGFIYTPRNAKAAEGQAGLSREQEKYIDRLYNEAGVKGSGKRKRKARKSG